MLLCEEYLQRHQLKIKIFPRFKTRDYYLLFGQSKQYTLVCLKPELDYRNDGSYTIQITTPIHNSRLKTNCFEFVKNIRIEWDEIEDYFIEFSSNFENCFFGKQLDHAVWRIFVYCFDGWFASNFSNKDLLLHSLTDFKVRNQVLQKLKVFYPHIHLQYNKQFRCILNLV